MLHPSKTDLKTVKGPVAFGNKIAPLLYYDPFLHIIHWTSKYRKEQVYMVANKLC